MNELKRIGRHESESKVKTERKRLDGKEKMDEAV